MFARITLVRSDSPAREVLLDPAQSYVLGRAPECDVCLDDEELSRRHARLSFSVDRWTIVDLGSKNGVVAGGRPEREVALTQGACVGLGATIMRFDVVNEAQYRATSAHDLRLRQMTLDGRARIDSANDISEALQHLLDSVLSITEAERGFALLTQPDGELEVACSCGVDVTALAHPEFDGSRSAVRTVLRDLRPVVACDVANELALATRQSILAARTRALVCLPLTMFDRVIGVIYADSRTPGKLFTDLDVQLLGELAEHAAIVIAAAQLGEELQAVDQKIRPVSETMMRLRGQENRIPGFRNPVPGARRTPLTGLRWSVIDNS
jgi:putative methionine-R-sulfoxide reductase with GAF domain